MNEANNKNNILFREFVKYQEGSYEYQEILNQICENNSRLSAYIANRFVKNNRDNYEDLQAVANVGMVRAAKNFDINKNFTFSTYAYKCMFFEICNYLKREKRQPQVVSFETPSLFPDDDNFTLGSILQDEIDIEDDYINKDTNNQRRKFIDRLSCDLTEKEKEAITLRYLTGNKNLKYNEIAYQMGESKSSVSSFISIGRKKIKREFQKIKKYKRFFDEFEGKALKGELKNDLLIVHFNLQSKIKATTFRFEKRFDISVNQQNIEASAESCIMLANVR